MKLPPIHEPMRYAGLYVYDFGNHVSVGYTAGEIAMLRFSELHRNGQAYEIYRVNENGGFELRGVIASMLVGEDAIAFLYKDPLAARRGYDMLRAFAEEKPFPVAVELVLARAYSIRPENATFLTYPTFAGTAVSRWLNDADFKGGDDVLAGGAALSLAKNDNVMRIASCRLKISATNIDREADEVLRMVDQPLQR